MPTTENLFIAHPTTPEQVNVLKAFVKALKIKFEITPVEKPYNPEFVAKIKESQQQFKEGKFTSVKVEDFGKYIDSL